MGFKIFYDPSPKQEEFHCTSASEFFFLLMLGGKGSGKTWSLVMKTLQLAGKNKGVDGGMLCPTLKMFKRDVLPTFKKLKRKYGLRFTYNKSDSVMYFPDTDNHLYIFHSEDDGESIAGPNLGWGAINEVTLCSQLAYAEFVSRIREESATFLQLAMSGTPEDLAWVQEEFFEKERDDLKIIFISTRDNRHLSPQYIKNLEATYDKQRQKAYIDGNMVTFNGKPAAWSFREKHVKKLDIKPIEVWVSLDFNVSPLAATIWYVPDRTHKLKMYARRCIKLEMSNDDTKSLTARFCDKLKEELANLGLAEYDAEENIFNPFVPVAIFPDPAGKSRSTRSHFSDIQIIEDNGFEDIRYKKKIISIKDCLNSLNNLLDKDEMAMNPECKELLIDLRRCKIKDDVFEIDKSDPKRTHWLDGAKDMCDYEYPVVTLNAQVTVS